MAARHKRKRRSVTTEDKPYSDARVRECPLVKWRGDLDRCRWCNKLLVGKQRRWCAQHGSAWANEHIWSYVRRQAIHRDRRRCVKCCSTKELEVNHIVPCMGKHHQHGCWHHLSGLETLCHKCHLVETARQFNYKTVA